MKPVNTLLTALSLISLLVIIERISPTTAIILQPYNFLRIHEVLQMSIILTIGVVVSFYLLKIISHNFANLKDRNGTMLGLLYFVGLYFYATGNGAHEIASYTFNAFCDTNVLAGDICGSLFFNDYYFGNIVYFIGFFLGNISLIMLEKRNPTRGWNKQDISLTAINGVLFALTLIAYAAFDRVLVGLYFLIIGAILIDIVVFSYKGTLLPYSNRKKLLRFPFTLYCLIAYNLGAIVTLLIRLH